MQRWQLDGTGRIQVVVLVVVRRGVSFTTSSIALVLNTEDAYPRKQLPGGVVFEGESLEQAAVRKASEELGLAVDTSRLRYLRTEYRRNQHGPVACHSFRVNIHPQEEERLRWNSVRGKFEISLVAIGELEQYLLKRDRRLIHPMTQGNHAQPEDVRALDWSALDN